MTKDQATKGAERINRTAQKQGLGWRAEVQRDGHSAYKVALSIGGEQMFEAKSTAEVNNYIKELQLPV